MQMARRMTVILSNVLRMLMVVPFFSCSACSWIFMDSVPSNYKPQEEIECSEAMPVIDTMTALLAGVIATAGLASGSNKCEGENKADGFCGMGEVGGTLVGVVALIPTVIYGASAATGFYKNSKCQDAKKSHEEWLRAQTASGITPVLPIRRPPAPPPGPVSDF
jgi:hypothetical protein